MPRVLPWSGQAMTASICKTTTYSYPMSASVVVNVSA